MSARLSNSASVYIEDCPNPHSLKFIVSTMLAPKGMSFDFPTVSSAVDAPLARELFTYPFVVHVFYMSNFITITKMENIEWLEVQDTLRVHIKKFIEGGQPIINSSLLVKNSSQESVEVIDKIKAIFDKYVKPVVQQDGGAIIFHSYVNGVITVRLQGACRGCPASEVTLKRGIENIFKKMMPNEVSSIEAME